MARVVAAAWPGLEPLWGGVGGDVKRLEYRRQGRVSGEIWESGCQPLPLTSGCSPPHACFPSICNPTAAFLAAGVGGHELERQASNK